MSKTAPLIRIGGSGSLGVTLPKEELAQRGIEAGDEVVLLPSDDPDSFTVYLPRKG